MYKEKLFISGGFSLDYLLLISEYDKYDELSIGQQGWENILLNHVILLMEGYHRYISQQFSKTREKKNP